MKLASSLVVVVLASLLSVSPASAVKSAVKCESGLTPVDPVPATQLAASPTMAPAVVAPAPAPTPALTQAPVVMTSAPTLADSSTESAYGAPVDPDADADDASAPEDDGSTPDDETATPAPTTAPVAQRSSAYGDEVGAEYDFGNLSESDSAQHSSAPAPAPAAQTQTQTSATPQDGVDPTTCLEAHNRVRAEVGVAALTWDADLASKGAAWAQHMSDLNFFDHHTPGQSDDQMNNLYSGTDCLAAVDAFASEKPLLPADRVVREDGYKAYGHYSMMVWRATTRVGCGRGADENLVCYYETPGNSVGEAAY
ncbi:hypothetical protein Gpo141_00003319 [Globisporangium polare]